LLDRVNTLLVKLRHHGVRAISTVDWLALLLLWCDRATSQFFKVKIKALKCNSIHLVGALWLSAISILTLLGSWD